MTNVSKIGEKIKIFRKKLGLQANKLAEQLNISPSYLNLIENGKRNVDAGLLLKICQELRIELSELENFEEINLENSKKAIAKFIGKNDLKKNDLKIALKKHIKQTRKSVLLVKESAAEAATRAFGGSPCGPRNV